MNIEEIYKKPAEDFFRVLVEKYNFEQISYQLYTKNFGTFGDIEIGYYDITIPIRIYIKGKRVTKEIYISYEDCKKCIADVSSFNDLMLKIETIVLKGYTIVDDFKSYLKDCNYITISSNLFMKEIHIKDIFIGMISFKFNDDLLKCHISLSDETVCNDYVFLIKDIKTNSEKEYMSINYQIEKNLYILYISHNMTLKKDKKTVYKKI